MARLIRIALLGLVAAAGCSPTIRWPRLAGPGPAPMQRAEAEAFDPYPLPDLGPEIVGGRPRDYAVPVDPVTRANQYNNARAAAAATPIPVGPPLAPPAATYGAPAPTFGAYPHSTAPAVPRY